MMGITDNVVLIAFVGTVLILVIGALILTIIVRRLHAQESFKHNQERHLS